MGKSTSKVGHAGGTIKRLDWRASSDPQWGRQRGEPRPRTHFCWILCSKKHFWFQNLSPDTVIERCGQNSIEAKWYFFPVVPPVMTGALSLLPLWSRRLHEDIVWKQFNDWSIFPTALVKSAPAWRRSLKTVQSKMIRCIVSPLVKSDRLTGYVLKLNAKC